MLNKHKSLTWNVSHVKRNVIFTEVKMLRKQVILAGTLGLFRLRREGAVRASRDVPRHRFRTRCRPTHRHGSGLVRMTLVGIASGFRAHSRGRISMLAGWFRTVGRLRCAAKALTELRETFRAIDSEQAVGQRIASVAVW